MAADTPTAIMPPDGETGLRPDEPVRFIWSPYSGAGSLDLVQVQVATDSGFAAADIVLDTLQRLPDSRWLGAEWFEWLAPKTPGQQYHWRVRVVNTIPETSSYSTTFDFTMSDPGLDAGRWGEGQA